MQNKLYKTVLLVGVGLLSSIGLLLSRKIASWVLRKLLLRIGLDYVLPKIRQAALRNL